jgi:hypothetical protein
MSIAQIGGAASPQIIYGKNNTGAAVSPGAYLQCDLTDGSADADGYNFETPDLDSTKPETFLSRGGVVSVADGPMADDVSFGAGANIAVVVEGYAPLASVDGSTTNIAAGDPLIRQDGSTALVKLTNPSMSGGLSDSNVTASSEAGNSSTSQEFHDETVEIRANTLVAGDVIEFWATGYIADQNSTDTATISVQFGGTDVGLSDAINVDDNDLWNVQGRAIVVSTGATGEVNITGSGSGPDALAAATDSWPLMARLTSVNTTANIAIRTGVTFSSSSADNGSIQTSIGFRILRQHIAPAAVALGSATTATTIPVFVLKHN